MEDTIISGSPARFKPVGDRVFIKLVETGEEVAGGIIIPGALNAKPVTGTVVAVGRKLSKDGADVPMDVAVGDSVILPRSGWQELKFEGAGGGKYAVADEGQVLGIIRS